MPASHPTFLAVEIGGTKLVLAAGRADGRVLHRRRLSVQPGAGGEGIRAQLREALPDLLHSYQPRAVGVGFGGPVDRASATITRSHQIEGWSGFPLAEWLSEITSVPAAIENDANAAALGEAVCGSGQDGDPVFYITLGSGIGGGLVVNREIYHGSFPGESEAGHLRLDASGATLEQRCSGWAVDQRIREACGQHNESALARLVADSPGHEARHLGAALRENDPVAERIFRETVQDLALGLSHVVHLFHPARIILGGGLSLLGEPLRKSLSQALPRFVMEVFHHTYEIRCAGLGEDAVPTGALILAGRLT